MNISAWAIKNPIPSILLFLMLTLVGLGSYRAMKVQDFPDIELPMVTVSASLEGAAPEQVETEVVRKMENALASLSQVKHIYATASDGEASVFVEFELEKPVSEAVDDVRDALNRIRSDLPADMHDPVISRVNTSGRPILTYSVSSAQMDEQDMSWYVDNDVTKALLAVPGVGKVARIGGVEREVRVEINPEKLIALHVSAADVSRRIKQVQQESSGGKTDLGGAEQALRTLATVATVDELAAMDVALPDGRHFRLDQLASVRDGQAEPSSIALLDGKPVIAFDITRTKGSSEIDVARGVRAAVERLNAQHGNAQIVEAFNMVEPVQENFTGSMNLLYEGALLAVLVVWWFLRDLRATLVSTAALPLSVIPTFIGMHYFGFTLNTVTLLALALVVGILVDDAIVEIENIVRHLHQGKSPYQAAIEATEEIGLAVVATTFTLVSVFLPTAFMDGIPGKFFKQFGWTAALAVLASLVVARLLTPMMAAYFLRPAPQQDHDSKLMTRYLGWVGWCLHHRIVTILGALAFFIASLLLIPLLPKGFVPAADRGQTQVTIELPPSSTLQQTRAAAEAAQQIVMQVADVKHVFTAVGRGAGGDMFSGGGGADIHKANLTLSLTHRSERARKQQAVEAELREKLQALPGVRVTVGTGDTGEKLVLALKGDDAAALAQASQNVERDLRGIPGLGNITSSASLVRPEVIIRPDYARMAALGVTSAAIGETVRVATAGDYSAALAKLNLPQRQVPIRVLMPAEARQRLDMLERLPVPARDGATVMLANVADIVINSGSAQISRMDRSRDILINVELNGHELGEVVAVVDKLPSLQALPAGVIRAESGDAEEMQKLFASFGLAMLTGTLCVYVVLVLLFKDFLQPLTILVAIPLSIGGAFVALLLTKNSFSMPSLIGLLMLMGIVTKNSILLVEYAIVARRDHGMTRFDALVDACNKRARPILMTTIAMGAGMLPIAMGFGVDPSFRTPMATAVIGGLITSTLLSLLVVPVVFTYVDDALAKVKRLL
ncbi:MAG: efflux RND transporter permease subunit [Nitrosomonadales bacterium]|nr:efflux RND transporter permease subunit [Nitrosomonadales bacterium]